MQRGSLLLATAIFVTPESIVASGAAGLRSEIVTPAGCIMPSEDNISNETAGENKEVDLQNVVTRVANLPLVSSAYDMVSSAYASTKETHPYLKSVCNVAEKSVKTLTAAAVSGAQPLLNKLEPQIATANEYACKSLDKLEEKLPILQQPSEKVVASTKEVVSSTVNGAKNAVASGVSGVVDMTKSMVLGSVNTVMGSRVSQMVADGMEAVLDMSDDLVDHYLPTTQQELIEMAELLDTSDTGFSVLAPLMPPSEQESYFVRLGFLSSKVRRRAYHHSVNKLWNIKKATEGPFTQLYQMIVLVENVKAGVGHRLQEGQEKLHQMWLEWSKKQTGNGELMDSSGQPEVESQTLTMFRGLTQQLQGSCSTLISSVRGLPVSIQDKVQHLRHTVEDLHTSFSTAHSFQDISATILAQSRESVSWANEAMEDVLDYVVSHVPLPWVVGPFAPNLVELPEDACADAEDSVRACVGSKEKLDSPQKDPSEPEKLDSPQTEIKKDV
ncbi:perilipin-3-like [Heteronotia binoei]|uniref:perilipin-3-like n=1 Tax=Heteronotia binoei TaxID=13085 RepID=UPI00292CDE41|nr:perilipin-3-like [Heteronotia binoei]